ncbi:hypothetical protein [Fluviispira sanaruensis]|uniref:Uncharacterized protein n=1 Tax=Fluviispira sanaruensis TaxID=2493639 RepID=A0A4V0P2I8_FLUSA|nr:hypothetical protein [Fluviispira sanaruensis]BBH53377.1 hypothetical protein JCM31447_18200 [Fluviispira sanaruensis]
MLAIRESKIQFEKWLHRYNNKKLFYVISLSIAIHILLLYLISLIKVNEKDIITEENPLSPPPVHIQLDTLPPKKPAIKNDQTQNKDFNIPKNRSGGVLTDKNTIPNKSFQVPKELESNDKRVVNDPFKNNALPRKKDKIALPNKSQKKPFGGIESLLPQSSQTYIDEIRREARQGKSIQGDSGDIPIMGKEYAPSNEPQYKERFAAKDMSLYQFSQEFKEKFGAIWNLKDRNLPPESPLRPGDVVYYKIYIKGDGFLEKFENLTQKKNPNKDFSGADIIFKEVVSQVLPMPVPPRFTHSIVTEVIAIQVVSTNVFVQYSPQ